MIIRLILFLSFLLLLKPAWSQGVLQDTLLPAVMVTGFSKGEQINQQTAPIAYLSGKELQKFSPNDPVMAWNTLPGVNLEQRAIASYRVSIRGSSIRSPFGVRDVKVYWNGLPFTEANGTTALNLLSNTQMRSLEVVKGPAGSLYGAGLGGVMQISNFPQNDLSPLALHLAIGSFNQVNAGIKGQMKQKKLTHFYAFDYQKNDGYRTHNAFERKNFQLATRYQFNDNHQFDFHLLYSNLFYEIPGGLNESQLVDDPTQARAGSASQNASITQKTLLYGVGYTSYFGQNVSQSTHISGQTTDFQNPFILDYKEDNNNEWAIRQQWTLEVPTNKFNWKWDAGFEWQYADNSANNYGNVDGQKDTIRFADDLKIDRKHFFLQTQIKVAKWKLTLGLSSNLLQYDVNRQINAFAQPFKFKRNFDNELIPRVALGYQWTPQHLSFLALSEGFSSPTLDEIRTNEGSINTTLQAERGSTLEAGYKYYGNRLQLDATLFYSALRGTITTYTNSDGVVLFRNAGGTKQLGTEWGLNLVPLNQPKSFIKQLATRTSFNYYHFTFDDYVLNDIDLSGKALTGVPNRTFNQLITADFAKTMSLTLHYRYVSRTPLTDANTVYADSYHLLNASMQYTLEKPALTLFGGVENILNTVYSLGNDLNAFGGRYFQPAPGTNFYAGVKWEL